MKNNRTQSNSLNNVLNQLERDVMQTGNLFNFQKSFDLEFFFSSEWKHLKNEKNVHRVVTSFNLMFNFISFLIPSLVVNYYWHQRKSKKKKKMTLKPVQKSIHIYRYLLCIRLQYYYPVCLPIQSNAR